MTPVECIQQHLGDLSEDMAKCTEAIVEQAKATQTIYEEITSLREGQEEIRSKVAELSDEVGRMIGLFQGYVKETTLLRSEVREKLRTVGQR